MSENMSAEEKLTFAHSIIQKSLELGIAGICYHRNLFPSSFFDHDNFTQDSDSSDNQFINFSRKTILYQPTQKLTSDDEEMKKMDRFLLEARHLLQWLENGISVMKEGLLSKVIL